MNDTDAYAKLKDSGFTECPYCDGKLVDGKCECGWKPEFELPPNDSWEGRFGEDE